MFTTTHLQHATVHSAVFPQTWPPILHLLHLFAQLSPLHDAGSDKEIMYNCLVFKNYDKTQIFMQKSTNFTLPDLASCLGIKMASILHIQRACAELMDFINYSKVSFFFVFYVKY